jgi:hypothetical protein
MKILCLKAVHRAKREGFSTGNIKRRFKQDGQDEQDSCFFYSRFEFYLQLLNKERFHPMYPVHPV